MTKTTIATLAMILVLTHVAAAQPAASRGSAVVVAKDTLSRKLGISGGGIRVEAAESAEWPDTGLGCPEKGKVYSAVVTSGFIVKLRFRDQIYAVHVSGKQGVVCESSLTTPKRAPARKTGLVLKLVQMAREDLAARLEVPQERVKLKTLKHVTWPDTSLGCPEPGEEYVAREIAGYQIELEVAGEQHVYHADTQKAVRCEVAALKPL